MKTALFDLYPQHFEMKSQYKNAVVLKLSQGLSFSRSENDKIQHGAFFHFDWKSTFRILNFGCPAPRIIELWIENCSLLCYNILLSYMKMSSIRNTNVTSISFTSYFKKDLTLKSCAWTFQKNTDDQWKRAGFPLKGKKKNKNIAIGLFE